MSEQQSVELPEVSDHADDSRLQEGIEFRQPEERGQPVSEAAPPTKGTGHSANSSAIGGAVVTLRHEATNAVTAGFCMALVFSLIGLLPSDFGRKVGALVKQLIEHALSGVDFKVYGLVAAMGGVALLFAGTRFAGFIRDRVCKPLLSVLFHSCGLVLGTTAALVISCLWSATYRAQIGAMLAVAFLIVVLMLETGLGLTAATLTGKDLGWNKLVQWALRAVGVLLIVVGVLGFQKAIDLTKTAPEHTTCAAEIVANAVATPLQN